VPWLPAQLPDPVVEGRPALGGRVDQLDQEPAVGVRGVATAPQGRSSSTAVRVYETRWVGARATLEGWADAVWVVSAGTSDEAGDHRDDLLARRLRCGADPDLLAAPENADSVGESEHLVE
jgi:hypothetical protein